MDNNKFQKFAVFGLLYVNLGRPQDVLPFVKSIHPGMIFGLLVICTLFQSRKSSDSVSDEFSHEKKWFLALGIMIILSTFFSIYFRVSVEFIIEYSKVIVLLLGLVRVLEDERDFTLLATVFLFSVLTLCSPIVLGGLSTDRVSIGTFYDPNDLAMFVGCSIPFLLYLFHTQGFKVKSITLVTIAIAVITVIATQSRMGFIALVLNGLFYLLFNLSSQRNSFRKLIICFGVVFVFMTFAGDIYWNRVKTTIEQGQTGSGRTLLWKRGLQMVIANPVSGSGPGTYTSAYGRMLRDGYFEPVGNEYDRAWKTAHNSYLIVAAELGVAGFVFFMMIIWNSLTRLNQVRKLCAEEKDKIHIQVLANVSISSFFIFIFCSLFLSQAYSSLFITLIACSVLVRKIYNSERVAVA